MVGHFQWTRIIKCWICLWCWCRVTPLDWHFAISNLTFRQLASQVVVSHRSHEQIQEFSSVGVPTEVIKLEHSLKLKIKHNDWLLADTCPQAANHCALFWVWEWTQVLQPRGWSICHEKVLTTFFSHPLILQKVNGLIQRKLYLSKIPEGVQHFQGGLTFSRGVGVQLLIPYRNPYN